MVRIYPNNCSCNRANAWNYGMELRQSQQISKTNYASNCNSQYHFHRLSNLQKIRSQSIKTTVEILPNYRQFEQCERSPNCNPELQPINCEV